MRGSDGSLGSLGLGSFGSRGSGLRLGAGFDFDFDFDLCRAFDDEPDCECKGRSACELDMEMAGSAVWQLRGFVDRKLTGALTGSTTRGAGARRGAGLVCRVTGTSYDIATIGGLVVLVFTDGSALMYTS
jgi:hypothetical protein